MIEFQTWPKTPRLFRDVTVTEKIDGTNSCVIIEPITEEFYDTDADLSSEDSFHEYLFSLGAVEVVSTEVGDEYLVGAQSRNRLIFPSKGTDNYGFAGWVRENSNTLVSDLGPGRHYGEWWGKGVARNYGLDHRRFSLFNTSRFDQDQEFHTLNLHVVPVLYEGVFEEYSSVIYPTEMLKNTGSVAAKGFKSPEGIAIYHHAANQVFKVLLENDDISKTEVGQQ